MDEIAKIEPNGYKAISTFSGCGGSSLGYKMAGFDVLWANEFIPAAQEVYRANHPRTILDTRDIRKVTPEDVLQTIKMKRGELDLLDGSPPCASFSSAGKRERHWGEVKQYSDTKQRVDDLFFEFTRLVTGIQPKVFIAENVSGLLRGTAKGYFIEIMGALKACGYRVEARLLNAMWLGVPQARQRVIFVGVRNDLAERFGVAPAFPRPLSYTYTVKDALPWIVRFKRTGSSHNWAPADRAANTIAASDHTVSITAAFSTGGWVEAETSIERFAIGREYDNIPIGGNSKRYLNMKRAPIDGPSQTITSTAGQQGAAGVTHPTEKRKFSIAELKRICAFPDDFALTGTFEQQWERLGRAVPPVMMFHIAAAVRDGILSKMS